jgi:hypothetical protein
MIVRFVGVVWSGVKNIGHRREQHVKFPDGDDRANKRMNWPLRSKNVGATASALRGAYLTWNLVSVRRNTI